MAELDGGFQGGFYAYQWQVGVFRPQQLDGGGGGGVAGDDQGLHFVMAILVNQGAGEGAGAGYDEVVALFTIGRVAAVGDVDEGLVRQLGAQSF